MKRLAILLAFTSLLGAAPAVPLFAEQAPSPSQASRTDAEVKREIIRQSLASYPGNCPCPYNTDRAGRRCGRRSAYSRPRGASPICYEHDVTENMLDAHRKARGYRKPAGRAQK
jgi:hypothetical protein